MEFISAPLKIDGEAIPKETPSPSPVPIWDQPPDAPIMTYNWVDITENFKEACNSKDCHRNFTFVFLFFAYCIALSSIL